MNRSADDLALSVHEILQELEDVPEGSSLRGGLQETPDRVAAYLMEMTSGYDKGPEEIRALLKQFEDGAEGTDQMVFQGGIPFYSLCEHHMAPFFGVAHVAYIPKDRVVGLSKLGRLVDVFARRLQVQERMTNQIADALMMLEPLGIGVAIRARHLCIESRGARLIGTKTRTTALRGAIRDEPDTKAEFLSNVALADQQNTAI